MKISILTIRCCKEKIFRVPISIYIFVQLGFYNEADNTWVKFNTNLFTLKSKHIYTESQHDAAVIKVNYNIEKLNEGNVTLSIKSSVC
jgi:hypothetical protein